MALAVAEEVSETADAFTSRTLSFVTPAAAGTRVVVCVDLYTTTGVAATAGMISDDGGHTWVQDAGLTGDGSTGGVAILSTAVTTSITDITLTPGGSGNYCNWAIVRLNGAATLDDTDTASGNSTSPAAPTMTATTTDGLAFSQISTRNQSVNQTVPSTWTALHIEKDNSTHLAGGSAYSPNISSAGSVTSVWTSEGGPWFAAGVIYKATVSPFDPITRIMGGTDDRGWFGNDAFGGADNAVSTTFSPAIPAGYGVIVCLALYGYTPTDASLLTIAGSGNSLTLNDQISYGGGVGGSVSFFSSVLTSDCSSIGYDATALAAGDNGRYGQMMFYIIQEPDLTNGFKTVTGVTNVQTPSTTVAPGTITPATDDCLIIMGWTNRGHTEDLLPLSGTGSFDSTLEHTELHVTTSSPTEFGSVHNSITQSGSFVAVRHTTGVAFTPTITFTGPSPSSGEVRSVLTAYNISGGSAVASGAPLMLRLNLFRVF
jgi:hypothetical protein